jgi:UDP-N-acetylmuramate dehydrogenase
MKILHNHPLLSYNYFKINAYAYELILIESEEDYAELVKRTDFNKIPFLILGEGSNILFTRDFEGTCIKTGLSEISIIRENEEYAWLRIEAGMNWHSLVIKTIEMGLQGLENLSLIPGTVGAAPVQNIGAYGVEIEQFIDQVEALDLLGGGVFRFKAGDCEFDYRSSIFKNRYKNRFFIKSITLRLNKKPSFNISYDKIQETLELLNLTDINAKNISDAVIHIRESKLPDPAKIGNAGSFFKNPIIDKTDFEGLKAEFPRMPSYQVDQFSFKIPAAWLIEECGWKGKRIGDAGVNPNQPLVLVNMGSASGKDILNLSEKIRKDVAQKFGIVLQPEVNVL